MFYFSAYENEASQANIHSDHFGKKDGCGEKRALMLFVLCCVIANC